MERDPLRRPPPPAWRRYAPLVGLALLAWILSRLDGDRMLTALSSTSATHVMLALLLFTGNALIKALRWGRMLYWQGIALSARVTLATFLAALFYGQFTLGRVGELYRVEALLERGVAPGRALSSCVFDRVLDVYLVLVVAAVLGALVFGEREAATIAALALLAGTGAGVLVMVVEAERGPRVLQNLVRRLLSVVERPALGRRLVASVRDLLRGVRPLLAWRALLEAAVLTTLGWAGYFAAIHTLAEGMGLHVSPLVLVAAASLAALSSLLPITVSGLGARELIYAELLGRYGVPAEASVVLALLHLGMMTACVIVIGSLGIWARARQPAPAPQD